MSIFGSDHRAAFICNHVFAKERPILLVAVEDGDLMFLCGDIGHDWSAGHVVGVGHLLAEDPSLGELADLNEGEEAERASRDDAWVRRA